MLEQLVRQWQAGWSASRGWTNVNDDDGVLSIKIFEQERTIEYVVADSDSHPERLERATVLAQEADGTSWVTVATRNPEHTTLLLRDRGLTPQVNRQWLMTIALQDQPNVRMPAGYTLVREPEHDVIVMRALRDRAVAASGRMAVVGSDAVADRIETEPRHRRRGLGSALMAGLVAQSRLDGADRGILIASLEGLRLYESLGWTVEADVVVARSH